MYVNDSSFWKYQVYADILGGSSGWGVKRHWVVDDSDVWQFGWLLLRKL